MRKTFTAFLMAIAISATPLLAETAGRDDLSVHSFKLRHKAPERAAAMIEPLMSSDGSFSIQPSTRTLVVSDRGENMKSIVTAIERFDSPPQQFSVVIKLVAASRSQNPVPVAADLREVAGKLGGVLRFNSFEKLGELRVAAREGSPVIGQELSPVYRADFRIGEYDPASDTIKVEEFQLLRGGEGQLSPVLKTTLNLKVGQTVILGASRDSQSQKALMIVAVASRD